MLLSYSHFLFHKNLGSRHKFVPMQGFIQDFVLGEVMGRGVGGGSVGRHV